MVYKVSRITSKVFTSALIGAFKTLSFSVKVFAFAREGLATTFERAPTAFIVAVVKRCCAFAFAVVVALFGMCEVVFKGVRAYVAGVLRAIEYSLSLIHN